RIQAGPAFGLGFAAKPGHAYFHLVAAGGVTLRTEDGTQYELTPGNAVFISHGGAHQLLSSPEVPVQDIDSFNAAALGDAVCAVDARADAGVAQSTLLFSGCMEFELGSLHGLGRLMPDLMLIDAKGQRYPGLMPILAAMEREVSSARIGFAGILARLADVVAAMVVRGWVECACGNASGLVAALRDPRLAKALLALHQQPGRDW
ncbi:cupin domain-containing protein, partial [Pseudomonas sp. K5002]